MSDLPTGARPAGGGPAFTVFTATYNRAHTLPRVYESLRAQTFRDFEWLIVDDGSTDGTGELARRWQQEADFPVRYFRQENQGKHIAFNRGAREARGTLLLDFDSDDACVPEALERLMFHWEAIPPDRRGQFAGLACRCLDERGRPVGGLYPSNPTDSDHLEMRFRYKVTGEAWLCHRTEVLRRFPFPDTVRGCCIPETVVWHRMARQYQMRFINEHLRIYYQGANGQLTRLSQRQRVPGRLLYAHPLFHEMDWFWHAPSEFLKKAVQYALLCFLAGEPLKTQWGRLTSPPARLLWLTGVVPAYLLARSGVTERSKTL